MLRKSVWERKMRKHIFLISLLGILALTGGCGGGGGNDGAGSNISTGVSIIEGQSLPFGKPFFDGIYAGRVDQSDAFIAIVSNSDTLKAYICDDAEISEWFTGENTDRAKTLVNGNQVVLSLNRNGDNEIVGSVLLSDGVIREFVAGLSEDHLLVRGQDDDHSEFKALAGWIKLADGEQRGTMRFNPRVKRKIPVKATLRTQKAPRLTIVKKKPVTKGIRVKILPKIAAALKIKFPPVITFPIMNPINPTSLGTPSANGLKYVWTSVGDSFGAGEGNPIINATLIPLTWEVFTSAVWGPSENLPLNVSLADVNACHRSDEAGAPKANRELVRRFPDVTFEFASYACSGAKIPDLIFDGQMAGDRFVTEEQSSQIVDAAKFASQHDEYDAVYMHIGGNDAGFEKLIANCINPFVSCKDMDVELGGTTMSPTQAISGLEQKYKDLDLFIRKNVNRIPFLFNPHDFEHPLATDRPIPLPIPQTILLSQLPDPLSGVNDDDCILGFGSRTAFDLLSGVSPADVAFVRSTIVGKEEPVIGLRGAIKNTETLGWEVVDGPIRDFKGHGICVEQKDGGNFINSNYDALAIQGDDSLAGNPIRDGINLAGGVAFVLGPITALGLAPVLPFFTEGVVNVSNGAVHPNDAGYEAYKVGIVEKVVPLVQNKINKHLVPPGRLRVSNVNAQGDIQIMWDDKSTMEDRYKVTVDIVNRFEIGISSHELPIDAQQFDLDLATIVGVADKTQLVAEFQVQACRLDRCTPVETITTANFPPKTPSFLDTRYIRKQPSVGAADINELQFNWRATEHAKVYVVEHKRTKTSSGREPADTRARETKVGGIKSSFGLKVADSSPGSGGQIDASFPQGTYEFRVSACNHAGCSPYSDLIIGIAAGEGGLGPRTADFPDPDFLLQANGNHIPNPKRPSILPGPGQ